MRDPDVASVMTTQVITARPETPFKELVATMTRERISALAVVDERNRPIGVVSEADTLAKQEFHGGAEEKPRRSLASRRRWQRSLAGTAAELMTTPVLVVHADEPVTMAAQRLVKRRVRRLFVVDRDGSLVGVVSRRDLLRAYLRSDEEILADIQQQVLTREMRLAPDAVTVAVSDGMATVDGSVDRRTRAEEVVRLVRALPGVVAVHSNLEYAIDDVLGTAAWTGFRP